MQYNTSRVGPRTETYRFTIKSKDDQNLKALRQDVKAYNKELKRKLLSAHIHDMKLSQYTLDQKFKCVKLQGRGPRVVNGKYVHPGCFHSLRHKYAESFAVYVEDDWHYTRMFNYFLESGITVTEQQKLQQAEHAAFIARMNAKENKTSTFVKQLMKIK